MSRPAPRPLPPAAAAPALVPSEGSVPAPASRLSRGGPRWERRKESRPSEVLDAALEVFVDRGYASARLEDVAARAGVSKGTLYLYFDNKEELFKAVVRQSILPLIHEFRAAIEASPASGPELLAQFLHRWWTAYGNTRLSGVAKLCIAEAGNFPEVARFWREEVIVANDALVAAILRRGIERGEFRPVAIEPTVALVMAPLVLRALMRDSVDNCCPVVAIEAHTLIEHHLDSLLRALAPERAADAGPAAPRRVAEATGPAATD